MAPNLLVAPGDRSSISSLHLADFGGKVVDQFILPSNFLR